MEPDPLPANGQEMVVARSASAAGNSTSNTQPRLILAAIAAGADMATVTCVRAMHKAMRETAKVASTRELQTIWDCKLQ